MKELDVIIVGGGAAGYFAALNVAELAPYLKIAILEKNKKGLHKVKVSGGGRCNVTHAEFVPSGLVKNYPRGEKELLGPFHQYMTGDIMEWFGKRGVELKVEDDGRIFPITDSSQTIIDCFLNEAKRYKIEIYNSHVVNVISRHEEKWRVETNNEVFIANKILIATGSSSKVWEIIESLGHTIVDPVPSLFTFNVDDDRIKDIPGIAFQEVEVKILDTNLESVGSLLITHVGLSGPAILKLSAFGARILADKNYNFKIQINFLVKTYDQTVDELKDFKLLSGKKKVVKFNPFDLPKRFWNKVVDAAEIKDDETWADLNRVQLEDLGLQLTNANFQVTGKSTFKEEFVTAGGVDLKDINFKTFESRLHENLYFAGEVLNIDAITGGFNFQNAWTGAYIAAQSIVKP